MMKQIKKKDYKQEIGDFIFTYRKDETISKMIAKLTCGDSDHPVSHIGCCIDNSNVVEALGQENEVVMNNIFDILKEKNIKLYLAKPLISKIISDYEYENYLLSKLKKKYDYWNLIRFQISKILFGKSGSKQNKDKADDRYICSELGSEAIYKRFGVLSDWNRKQYNPNELFNMPQYFEYFEIV